MTVHHDAELDAVAATMPGLRPADYGWNVREPWRSRRLTPARRADGPSACPGGSPHEPGTCRQKRQFLGARSKPQSPSACGTQAKTAVRGRSGSRRTTARLRYLAHAGTRVSFAKAAYGCSHANAGAAGAALRPVVPHAPTGQARTEMTGVPCGRSEHGAMTCVRTRSPDGAKRNPGLFAESAPDFATLHPGYEEGAVPGVAQKSEAGGLFDN
jgi:hypothetical protein